MFIMKHILSARILRFPLFLTLCISLTIFSFEHIEAQDFTCGMNIDSQPVMSTTTIPSHNGAYLPSKGTIRGLVLYLQTRNDNVEDATWPLGQIPKWSNDFVSDMAARYSAMSNGALTLELDTYPTVVIPQRTELEYYASHQNIGQAMKEILVAIDPTINFGSYDNWNSEGHPYDVRPGKDKKVDLILVIVRRTETSAFAPFTGVSDLGFAGYQFVDSSTTLVYGGTGTFNDASSSGLTICRGPGSGMIIDLDWALKVSAHEFMHKLYGGKHPAEIFGGLGMLANSASGTFMCGVERHILGYIQLHALPSYVDTIISLSDYITQNDAAVLPIPGYPDWYYVFEFRAKESKYDSAPGKGLYIYRFNNTVSLNQKEIIVMSAEGNWQWALDSTTNRLYRVSPDPLGGYNIYQKVPLGSKVYAPDGYWGVPESAFSMKRPYFCTLRNPTPDFIHGSDTVKTNLHLQILAMDETTVTIHFQYNAPAILSTSNPEESTFSLGANFPNPVSIASDQSTTIQYSLMPASNGEIDIYDALGKLRYSVEVTQSHTGVQSVPIPCVGFTPGFYWYLLRQNGNVLRKSFLILP